MMDPAKQKGPRLVLIYLTHTNIYIQQKEKYKTNKTKEKYVHSEWFHQI